MVCVSIPAVCAEHTALLCSSTDQSGDRHGVSAVMARPDDAIDEHHANGQAPGGSAEPSAAAEGHDAPQSSATSNGQHAASEAGAAAASDGAALAADPVSAAAALAERSVSEPSSASEHPPSSRGGPGDGPRGGPRRGNTQKPPADLVPAEEIWFRRGDIVAGRVIWASNQGARIELLKNPRIHGCVSAGHQQCRLLIARRPLWINVCAGLAVHIGLPKGMLPWIQFGCLFTWTSCEHASASRRVGGPGCWPVTPGGVIPVVHRLR